MEMIGVGTSETRIIGIHGMGGLGKTTIAKLIYNKLLQDFENYCFLRDIRETSKGGIQCLQNQLISDILKTKCIDIKDIDEGTQTIKDRLSNKRVLLLLDDVEEENHIDALVGKPIWLGKGSKIIITTRNKDILYPPKVDYRYEVSSMDPDQSLQLFSKHAFRRDSPLDEYMPQSCRAIGIAGGLPLTLEVLGSLLGRTEKKKWDLMLNKLESVPHETVQSKLKISYDALDVRQQHIFLDIACFFIGYDKDIMIHFWDESKFPEEAMEVLQNISLIKIEKSNRVWMHDQLRDLGREIVCRESKMEIEEQSRVWDPKEALDLLRRSKGRKEVEAQALRTQALRLHFDHERQHHFTHKDFERISNLRFLQVDGLKEHFSVEERLLWHESPSNVIPMERLILLSCKNLVEIDVSICRLKSLVFLDVSFCEKLQRLPDELARDLTSLKYLGLDFCYSLERLPNTIGNLESLNKLNILYTEIEELPDSIGKLKSLINLNISSRRIKELPNSIGQLENLKVVKIRCEALSKIPDAFWTIEKLEVIEVVKLGVIEAHIDNGFDVEIGNHTYRNRSMRILRLSNGRIHVVPRLPESLIILELSKLYMDMFPDLSNLANLKELKLWFVRRDSYGEFDGESDGPVEENPMPLWIENLSKLETFYLSCPYVTTMPADIRSLLPQLKSLELCLVELHLYNCKSCCSMEDLSNLKTLSDLDIVNSAISEIQGLDRLENLQTLELRKLQWVEILPDLSNLNKLGHFTLQDCGNLVEIQGDFPPSLESFSISECGSLQKLPDLSSLKGLRTVEIEGCGKLNVVDLSNLKTLSNLEITNLAISEIRGLDRLENLQELRLGELQQVEVLPDLSNLNKLRDLHLYDCGNLVEIQGHFPPSLKSFSIWECGSLQKLLDLSSLKG
ncbi:hypothetical protein EUGRSUZ_H03812 [Eucalyptus grandis]|uniref:Uncharacterized protein n=2 Tax=Eucalyptus grandis TaxID=71139 RepID=A0ACC3JUA6_EUCGR|nr:hypothetical protein EUGRSUZ_H03812 [Eucalyptus grandis]